MALSIQECARKLREEYPDFEPYMYTEFNTVYVFNLVKKGSNPRRAMAEFHMVDPNSGDVTGAMPPLKMLGNAEFQKAWKNAKKISGEASHSFFLSESNFLSHHGIPGQHWGERNGPPYPLDQKTHNNIVKNQSGYSVRKKEANGSTAGTGETKGILSVAIVTAAATIGISLLDKALEKPIKRHRQRNFDQQNKELSNQLIGDISEDKDFSNENPPRMIAGTHSEEADMAACNPKYFDATIEGTSSNCCLCSYTYDLRRRGYDVTAKSSMSGNYPDILMEDLYKGAKTERVGGENFDNVLSNIAKKYPEGARGELSCYSDIGCGHSMIWEVKDGRAIVRCPQSNQVFRYGSDMAKYAWNPNMTEAIRVDNLELRIENVGKVCNELKPGWKNTVKKELRERKQIQKLEEKKQPKVQKIELTIKSDDKNMSKQEKQKSLEEQWKKSHPGRSMDADARDAMNNWVDSNMWSMYGHEGAVLSHQQAARWCVRMSGQASSYSDNLMHYGIPGQKWHVRRFQLANGTYTPEGRERYGLKQETSGSKKEDNGNTSKSGEKSNKDGKQAKYNSESSKWKAREASELSDEELNRRNSRLQRERQYRDMTTPQWKKEVSQAAKKIFIGTAVTALTTVVAMNLKEHVTPFLNKFVSDKIMHIKRNPLNINFDAPLRK